jgi:hypothetical protein
MWGAATNPWTGLVQAWQMPLGPHPVHQPVLSAPTHPGPFIDLNTYALQQPTAPLGLYTTLYGTPTPNQYQGGSDWIMDHGASSHMGNTPGVLSQSSPANSSSSIIVDNGSSLPVQYTGTTTIPTSSSALNLNHVLISSNLIKNLISVRALTRDIETMVKQRVEI